MSYNIAYHVRPRYTPGSPAQVVRTTAVWVARAEAEAYHEAKTLPMNPQHEKACLQGTAWIVWTSWEAHGLYHRKCLITDCTESFEMAAGVVILEPPKPLPVEVPIRIAGRDLTNEQRLTVRVALNSFLLELKNDLVITGDLQEQLIYRGYQNSIVEIFKIMREVR